MGVAAFATQLAVDRFDERIVRRLARAGEVQNHSALVSLQIHVPGDELDPVVHPDHLGIADLPICLFQREDRDFTALSEPGIDHRR